MERKHLVIVAIYFPPIISIASQRILAFARYFDKRLFRITLITLDTGQAWQKPADLGEVEIIRLRNDHLLKPVNLRKNYPYLVHKAGAALNKLMDLVVMDEYAGWTRNAAKKLREVHARDRIDILLSSFAPVAAHLAVLQSGLPGKGIRWIADMRDEMSLNPFYSRIKQRFFAGVERRIFGRAWMVTTTSDAFLANFRQLGSGTDTRFEQIKNGFDFDPPVNYGFNPVFTITHAGTFYSDIKPHTFFRAVSELMEEKKLTDFRINLIGAGNAFIIPAELKDHVHLTGRIVHAEAVRYMLEADANLIIMPASKKGTLPGKMYECLGALKPIVALMDEGEQAAGIIRRANAGFIAGFDDIGGIKDAILKAYDRWKSRRSTETDRAFIEQFRRSFQVGLLQKIILNERDD